MGITVDLTLQGGGGREMDGEERVVSGDERDVRGRMMGRSRKRWRRDVS